VLLSCHAAGLLACLALRFDLLRTFAPTAFEAGAERHGAAAVALTDDQQQHAEPAVISQADNSTRPGISSSSSLSGQPAADDVSWSSYEVTTLQSDPMQRPHNSALFTAAAQFVNRPLKDKKYFKNATVAHVVGLFTAFAANSITHLGQPALLYIVPAMSLAVVGTAASQSEVGRVWSFTDAGLGPQGNPAAGQGKAASTPRKE
jgi:minor histocompatibility antigen H13